MLDLDETLIHCKSFDFDNVTAYLKVELLKISIRLIKLQVTIGNQEMSLFVSKRPGLEEFLARMAQCYNLVLFTSALKEYAHVILKQMKIEKFFCMVLHRGQCQRNPYRQHEKSLAILRIPPKDIILVDVTVLIRPQCLI